MALLVLCSLLSWSAPTAASDKTDHTGHGMHGDHMDHMDHMDHHSMMMQAFEYDERCPDRCYGELKKALPELPPKPVPDAAGASSTADDFQLLIQRWCKDANVPGFKLALSKARAGRSCQKDRLVEQRDGAAVALWATLPSSYFQLRRASILLDSCITGSLGLQSSCWPYGPIRTNLAAAASLRNETRARRATTSLVEQRGPRSTNVGTVLSSA